MRDTPRTSSFHSYVRGYSWYCLPGNYELAELKLPIPPSLRSSSVPKSVQSRCKVGEEAILWRRKSEFGTEEYGKYYSLSSLPLQRYFLVSCTIIPERNSNDKRLGIAIRALKMSAKSQTRLRLTTAPR